MRILRSSLLPAAVSLIIASSCTTSTNESLDEYAGRWVNLQNQYEDGTHCGTGAPSIGMELIVRSNDKPHAKLIQVTSTDSLEFVFPLSTAATTSDPRDLNSDYPHTVSFELADEMTTHGSLKLPASASADPQINALKFSRGVSQAGSTLPALGISRGMEIPKIKIDAMNMSLPASVRSILTADQFTRCTLPQDQ